MVVGAFLIFLSSSQAQQPSLGQATGQSGPPPPDVLPTPVLQTAPVPTPRDKRLFQDIDLLRRDDFEKASEATASVRVIDSHSNPIMGLGQSNFLLTVNGSVRKVRLLKESSIASTLARPMVLLVFPPNQPTIHYIAVRDCISYFTGLSEETLPWSVGIFDANGSFTPFTSQRSVLLSNLEAVRTAHEPAQYSTDRFMRLGEEWDGDWLTKANNAITEMQRLPGPKLIMAMNPLDASVPGYEGVSLSQGHDAQPLAQGSPADLTPIAQEIGAHIYIANVGGPEPIIPGGDAASTAATWGTKPSMHQQISRALIGALNHYAAVNSQMMLTAQATLGGFSNSIPQLAAQMQRDLDDAYHIQFDLTPNDQDIGIPEVSVKVDKSGARASILDVAPVLAADVAAQRRESRETAHALLASIAAPITSPDFSISQRVDYFPVRSGFEAVLPMSCLVKWTGPGAHPAQILIVESVVDRDLNVPILERTMDSSWDAREIFWERDGQLRPGRYIWRVAVAGPHGRILASAQQNVTVAFPRHPVVAVSSLVLGDACKPHPSANGLRKRSPPGDEAAAPLLLTVDPMQLGNCRFTPEPDERFGRDDTLHALIRIYPLEKLEKNRPEAWSARFTLRSATSNIESEKQIPFRIDSGSGFFASVAMRLAQPGVTTGQHTFDVEIQGPGLRRPLSQTESVFIAP
jgi:hypothetical protein